MVHERSSWRVDGGFPEGKLASAALRGLDLGDLIVLLRRLVVAATIITALLHCRICSRQRRLPRPPPQHPTSVPFIRKQPSTVATNPHNCYYSPYKVIAAKFADTK